MGSITFSGGHQGHCPEPFDALNGPRLGGGVGDHPLHAVRADELVRVSSGKVDGEFTLDHPVRVGEGIEGTLRLTAREAIAARKAAFRLVGLRLVEERRSESRRTGEDTTTTDSWIEANGRLFIEDEFLAPVIPAALAAGEVFETRFAIPAPRLGPPTAHLGEAIVAWAIDVRWDIAMGDDAFIARYLPIGQHPDLIRAGVGEQGGIGMLDVVDVEGATLSVTTSLPAAPGSQIEVTAAWPGAPGGPARIELHRRTTAPNGVEGIIASVTTDADALRAGTARGVLAVPSDAPPSFDGADLEVTYVVRVLVDRRLRPDAAVERPISIA